MLQFLPKTFHVSPFVEINIPFRVKRWICSEIDITVNSIMVTHVRGCVNFINKIWVGCEKQVKNVSLSSWFHCKLSKVEIMCNVDHFLIDSGSILWV